jgi:hypothetical protein
VISQDFIFHYIWRWISVDQRLLPSVVLLGLSNKSIILHLVRPWFVISITIILFSDIMSWEHCHTILICEMPCCPTCLLCKGLILYWGTSGVILFMRLKDDNWISCYYTWVPKLREDYLAVKYRERLGQIFGHSNFSLVMACDNWNAPSSFYNMVISSCKENIFRWSYRKTLIAWFSQKFNVISC